MALFTKFASNIKAMKSKLTVLYFSIWLGSTFWSVSGQFIDAETAPKWYFALFGGTFLCWMYGMSHFRSIPTTKKPHFTGIFLSISLCATALAFHGLLQWSGLWTPQPMFPVCGNFDNPAGIASALAFSLPFSLHYTQSPCTPLSLHRPRKYLPHCMCHHRFRITGRNPFHGMYFPFIFPDEMA